MKEQQKRIGSAEFRNTQFSYQMGNDGIEQFVSTPELQSGEGIGTIRFPVRCGQSARVVPMKARVSTALRQSAGSGVRLTNVQVPPAMRESIRHAEQNLYTQAQKLVGDRNPKQHELTVQVRALDTAGVALILACPP